MKKVSLALTIPIVFVGGFLVGAKAEQNKKHQSDADYIRLFYGCF